MDFVSSLRRLWAGICRRNSHDNITFADKSTLERLPGEILLIIAKFLPLHCAAILALSSKSLCFKLGSKPFENFLKAEKYSNFIGSIYRYMEPYRNLTPRQIDRYCFLNLLSRDLPDEVFCHFCMKIHTPETTDAEERWSVRLDGYHHVPKECYRYEMTAQYGAKFNFARINLAMKRARLGLDPSKQLLGLGETFASRQKHGSLEARIIRQRLYVRAVYRIYIPSECFPDLCFPGQNRRSLSTFKWQLEICSHVGGSYYRLVNPLKSILILTLFEYPRERRRKARTRKPSKRKFNERKYNDLIRCDRCATEFCVDIEDNRIEEKGDVELVVTAWQDFGRGEEPWDIDFYSHFIEGGYGWPKPVRPPLSSLKKTFEHGLPGGLALPSRRK